MNSDLRNEAEEVLLSLAPYQLDADGVLQEWSHEIIESEPGHRHFSPLISVFPESDLIRGDKDLIDGALRLFRKRLDSSLEKTGWNAAWISCLASRFGDKEVAWSSFRDLLGLSTCNNLMSSHNVLIGNDEAALFQIDGNFGGVAAVLEMLVTDFGDEIVLLPALPSDWADGSIKGYRTKGGSILTFSWRNGRLTKLEVDCDGGQDVSITIGSQN